MSITYTMANMILEEYFMGGTPTIPATMYLGLSTTAINSDGTGATEPSGSYGYARVAVPSSTGVGGSWSAPSSGVFHNQAEFTFPECVGTSWGEITHVFLASAVSGGDILYYDALTTARTVPTNTIVSFPADSIQVLMNNTQ